MNLIIPQVVTNEIIFKCISSLSSTILSSYNFYNYIVTNVSNDLDNFQNEIISTDLANKLLVASSIIKDIIKKHHFDCVEKNVPIEKIIESYKDQIKIEILQDEGFDIITHIQNNSIIADVPEPVKISLGSTLEIIDKINCLLEQIHLKIKSYSNSYSRYITKLNIKTEVDNLIRLDKIFEKRLELLLEIVLIYNDVVK